MLTELVNVSFSFSSRHRKFLPFRGLANKRTNWTWFFQPSVDHQEELPNWLDNEQKDIRIRNTHL